MAALVASLRTRNDVEVLRIGPQRLADGPLSRLDRGIRELRIRQDDAIVSCDLRRRLLLEQTRRRVKPKPVNEAFPDWRRHLIEIDQSRLEMRTDSRVVSDFENGAAGHLALDGKSPI